jgi:hypothetical protein
MSRPLSLDLESRQDPACDIVYLERVKSNATSNTIGMVLFYDECGLRVMMMMLLLCANICVCVSGVRGCHNMIAAYNILYLLLRAAAAEIRPRKIRAPKNETSHMGIGTYH